MSEFDIELMHRNYQYKGTELEWNGADTQDLFEKNCRDPKNQAKLQSLGWLEPGCITYKYNSFGFRDEEFDNRPCGIAVGCSHTEGIGLPNSAGWVRKLSELTGIHIWNLGVGGSSLDTTFRLLDHWLPKLKPKFVVACTPDPARIEVFYHATPIALMPQFHPKHLEHYYKIWISDNNNSKMLERKNLLAIQCLCNLAGIPFQYLKARALGTEHLGDARDLLHYGVEAHTIFAKKIYELL